MVNFIQTRACSARSINSPGALLSECPGALASAAMAAARECKNAITFRKQFTDIQDAYALSHAVVDTVRESLIVLDENLRVAAARRSFYTAFKVRRYPRQAAQ